MNAILESDLEGDDRDKRLERILYALNGKHARITDLMASLRIPFSVVNNERGKHIRPHTAWVEFINLRIRVERFFALHGYALGRTGGTPFDAIWIEPVHAGSPSV